VTLKTVNTLIVLEQHLTRLCLINVTMFALVLLALCLLFPPPPAFAQQPFITPSDVRLEVRTKDQQRTFYIG
jgi:hypothetical protein